MSLLDWMIVIIPVVLVYAVGLYSRRYARSVADFLSAGRVCGRYIISVGDIANALSIIGLMAFIEVHYKTGFALEFWKQLTMPLGIFISLTGFVTYRFRETKAMSLGQFLEMRYSRSFRIFAAALRSLSEIIANSIMPAIAARFFIYFLDLPRTLNIFGLQISTFVLIMLICLFLAISILCMGGTLALVITDSLQGMIMYPILCAFVVFILVKFSWTEELVPVMMDRVPGESFLNPFDLEKLRDFNVFFLIVTIYNTVFHRGSWIGAGYSSAARTPHEQKMAGLLGTFRGLLGMMFYVLLAVVALTVMNHADFSDKNDVIPGSAKNIRYNICRQVNEDVELINKDSVLKEKINAALSAKGPMRYYPNKLDPSTNLSQDDNLDTRYLKEVHDIMLAHNVPADADAQITHRALANDAFQQYKTLYHQQMLSVAIRDILPMGMTGLFVLLLVMAMISTDDTRIYSAALTVAQDVLMPLIPKTLTPKQHIWLLRWTCIGVGVIFLFGSLYLAQLDYIQLFVTIVTSLWIGGCAPVMIFGLYSRFGTTAGAWTSILTGMILSLVCVFTQRGWADHVYPFLERHGLVETVGNFLAAASKPFDPWIVWTMNPLKCPINSYEFGFMISVFTLILYIIVSKFTCKEPFNLDRMLHRGKYNLDGENKASEPWSLRNVFKKIIGITPEFTTGDKITAWTFFIYSFVYNFLFTFIAVLIWNAVTPWPLEWWGWYFFVVQLLVPGIAAFICIFVFGIGGVVDFIALFRDLKTRKLNDLDNGQVSGTMSLADKAELEAVDADNKADE